MYLTFANLTLVGFISELRAIGHPLTTVQAVRAFRTTVAFYGVAAGHRGALSLPTGHIAMTTRAFFAYIENVEEMLAITVTLA